MGGKVYHKGVERQLAAGGFLLTFGGMIRATQMMITLLGTGV
jgi:hypothetical protein